jgi:hypothetical protein
MEALITHLDSEAGAVVRYGPVLFVLWRVHNSLHPVEYADEAVKALTMRYGKERRLFYVHRAPPEIVGHGQSEKTRDAVMKHFDRTEPFFKASAIVIEATGFVGAVVRSVASTMMLVRRSGVKSRVFDDVRPGLRWIATMTEQTNSFDPDQLVARLGSAGLTSESEPKQASGRR